MNYRELFEKYSKEHSELYFPHQDNRQLRYEQFCLKLAGGKFKTFAALRKKRKEFTQKIFNRYLQFYNKQFDRKAAELKAIERELNALAPGLEIVPQGEVRVVFQASTTLYSCQTQPVFYAQVRAQAHSLHLAAMGIENSIEKKEYSVDVLARLEPWQVDCISRKPLDIDEWAWYCAAMGANPMVYNPYLDSEKVWSSLRERGGFQYENKYQRLIENAEKKAKQGTETGS